MSGESFALKGFEGIDSSPGDFSHVELFLPSRSRCLVLFALACTIGVFAATHLGGVSGWKIETAVMFGLAVWAGISTFWSP